MTDDAKPDEGYDPFSEPCMSFQPGNKGVELQDEHQDQPKHEPVVAPDCSKPGTHTERPQEEHQRARKSTQKRRGIRVSVRDAIIDSTAHGGHSDVVEGLRFRGYC